MSGIGPERWRELSPYLDRALDLSSGERESWLESVRTEDVELAADLEGLLQEQRALEREGFLEEGPALPVPSFIGQKQSIK